MQTMGSPSENHSGFCNHNVRFMQPLLLNFLDAFTMPVLFVKHLESELQGHSLQTVVLMTEDEPQRHWVVHVESGRHFKKGWKEFSLHHHLQAGDFVVFIYKSNLVFQVSVFDSFTACQRVSSSNSIPSSKGSKRIKVDTRGQGACKTEAQDTEADAIPSEKGQNLSCQVNLTTYNIKKSICFLPIAFVRAIGLEFRSCEAEVIDGKERHWQVKLNYKKCDGQTYIKRGWKDFLVKNHLKPGNVVCFELFQAGRQPVFKCYTLKSELNSSKKSMIKEAKAEYVTAVTSEQGQRQYPSFHVKITSYSAKRSIVYFPVHFLRESGLKYRCCVLKIIDEKGKTWLVKLNYKRADGQSYIMQGWKAFLVANRLKPGNVICFQLIEGGRHPILKCFKSNRNELLLYSTSRTKSKEAVGEKVTVTSCRKTRSQRLTCNVNLTSHCFEKSIIYFPVTFIRESGLEYRSCEVRIIDEEKRSWLVNLNYKKGNGKAYIYRGWKEIQSAKRLKPGDVVRFQLLEAGTLPVLKCFSKYKQQ